ncbi:MAG: hypothetical protein N2037_10230 [Acidimicrobiales bacterium]|nr:hypothetical protein [Acidimicrobiales bacterium]
MTATASGRITRDDIEAKFRELQGEIEEVQEEAVNAAIVVGAAVVVVVVVVAFWLGRRRGRKTRTVVEIRRV